MKNGECKLNKLTTWFKNVIQGNVWKTQTTPALPTTYYLGLSTTLPTVESTNVTEPSGNNYARIQLTGLSTPTNGLVTNTTNLNSNLSTGSWGVIPYYVIYDSLNGGNLCMFGDFTSPKTIDSNTILTIVAGELDLQLSDPA